MESLLIDREFRALIPPLDPSELKLLEESILEEGVRDALIIWNGYIVDGHNRFDIITKYGITDYRIDTKTLTGKTRQDVCIWIIDNQLGRRNISVFTRIELVSKRKSYVKDTLVNPVGRPLKIPPISEEFKLATETRIELSKLARTGKDTYWKGEQIIEKATEEQKIKLRAGEATINQVYVQIKRDEVKNKLKTTEWPKGKYRVIYADPPWKYSNNMPTDGEKTGLYSEQQDHYPLMTIEQIANLPVPSIALDNSVLFLWVTSPLLEESFNVINTWGFKYKTAFIWDKVKHNMGHYNSVRHELLLIAIKGSCQPDVNELIDSVQTIERNGRHSQKPEEFRNIIDKLYPYGPRIELFARKNTNGWDTYGNDIS